MSAGAEGTATPPPAASPDDGVAQKVVHGGAIRTVGFAVTNLIALAAAMLLARHLSQADFGRYGTVMALITVIYAIADGGLNIVGTRELSLTEPGAARRRLTGVVLGMRLVLGLAGVLLALAAALALGFTDTMVTGTLVAGIGGIFTAWFAALTLPALVELRNGRLLLVEVTRQLVQLVLTVAFVLAGYGLLAFFGVQALIGPLVLLALPLLIGRGVWVRPRYDRDEWRHMIRVALPIAIAGVLSIMYLKMVVLLGSLLLDAQEQSLLVMSTRAVEVLAGLPLLVVGVVLPVVSVAARDDRGRLRYVSQRLLESAAILGILVSLPLSFGAPTVLRILGGEQYVAATPALEVQAWVMLTVFLVQGGVVLLIALHHHRAVIHANLVGLACVLAAGLALLPARGAVGGASAALAADAVLALVMLGFVLRGDLRGQLQAGAFPRILLAALLAAGAGLVVPGGDIVAAATATAAFAVLALLLGAAPPEARDLLLRRHRTPAAP